MSKRGLPAGVQMRHDAHYVDILAAPVRTIGRKIAIELVEPNPEQPRSEFGDLTELTDSIREKGVLEPLLVRPNPEKGTWMIIAGERRWRASKEAGLTEVPCIEMELDDRGVAEIALIENLQRKDLNLWEEADGLAALADRFGYTQEEIAKKISKSRTAVTELMTIAGLPEDIRKRCGEAGIVQKSTLLEIARQFDDDAMHRFLDGVISGKVTTRAARPKGSERAKSVIPSKPQPLPFMNDADESFVFKFNGSDPEFELSLRFGGRNSATRAEILRALKSAFEAVKAESGQP